MLRRSALFLSLALAITLVTQPSASASDFTSAASAFSQLSKSSTLANPAVMVVDKVTGEIVYQSNAGSPRKPASLLKIVTAAAAYAYLSPSDSYTTSLWQGMDSKTVVIQGSLDPWISYDHKVAIKMKRTSLSAIQWSAINYLQANNSESLQGTRILYSNLFPQDVAVIEKYLKFRKLDIELKKSSPSNTANQSTALITESLSPRLGRIVDWALTWSDNLLSDRIARAAAGGAGFSRDYAGVELAFKKLLTDLNINANALVVKDGSGLSKANRVTALQISQLLQVIAKDPKYDQLIKGLPIGGLTGTLADRFVETAPTAIGLVRAKTGTLNGTTNLAGFIESGDHEYNFVIISDQHNKSYTVTKRVRATVDRILGKIANPLLPEIPMLPPIAESSTVVTP
jgi:D-alanyl-D-alanine carboxypeptidase/D-alanyl-D-alanine-endopeptidase (penicillin-binding protein 4)